MLPAGSRPRVWEPVSPPGGHHVRGTEPWSVSCGGGGGEAGSERVRGPGVPALGLGSVPAPRTQFAPAETRAPSPFVPRPPRNAAPEKRVCVRRPRASGLAVRPREPVRTPGLWGWGLRAGAQPPSRALGGGGPWMLRPWEPPGRSTRTGAPTAASRVRGPEAAPRGDAGPAPWSDNCRRTCGEGQREARRRSGDLGHIGWPCSCPGKTHADSLSSKKGQAGREEPLTGGSSGGEDQALPVFQRLAAGRPTQTLFLDPV